MNNVYDWETIKLDYDSGLSKKELKKKYKIKTWAWGNAIKTGKIILRVEDKPMRSLEEILVENSPAKDITTVKRRLLKEGILKNTCSCCGLTEIWQGKPIVLHLDHINGNNRDNRISNLRILCPNCHSQTETYCGKK
jgi:hypothetical protein